MKLHLNPGNEQAVADALGRISALSAEAYCGIARRRQVAASADALVVPKLNGDRATFKDPRAEADQASRLFSGQAMRALGELFPAMAELQRAMVGDGEQPQNGLRISG